MGWATAKEDHNVEGDLAFHKGDKIVVTRVAADNAWWTGYVEPMSTATDEKKKAIGELRIKEGALAAVPSAAEASNHQHWKELIRNGSGKGDIPCRLFVEDAGIWEGYCELTPSAVGQFPSSAVTIVAGGPPDDKLRGRVDDPTKLKDTP